MQPAAMLAVAAPYRFQDLSRFNSVFVACPDVKRQGLVEYVTWPPILVVFSIPTPVRIG